MARPRSSAAVRRTTREPSSWTKTPLRENLHTCKICRFPSSFENFSHCKMVESKNACGIEFPNWVYWGGTGIAIIKHTSSCILVDEKCKIFLVRKVLERRQQWWYLRSTISCLSAASKTEIHIRSRQFKPRLNFTNPNLICAINLKPFQLPQYDDDDVAS